MMIEINILALEALSLVPLQKCPMLWYAASCCLLGADPRLHYALLHWTWHHLLLGSAWTFPWLMQRNPWRRVEALLPPGLNYLFGVSKMTGDPHGMPRNSIMQNVHGLWISLKEVFIRLSLLEYWFNARCILNQTGRAIRQDGGRGGAMKEMTRAVETVYLH
jgi:hypothetical protein